MDALHSTRAPGPVQTNPVPMSSSDDQQPPAITQDENPWKRSCVLTLDGGGIRGYASLCVLKILMDAIGKHERGHKDPHESSFARSAPQAPALNGSAGHSQMGGSQHHEPPPRAPTDSSVVSSRSWPNLFRRQATTRSQQTNGISRQNTELETESSEVQRFLPCHYFDYIGGTSTGGLNAIMLGRLRMPVEECLDLYPKMARNVFSGQKRYLITRIMKGTSSKYDSDQLQREIQKIVQKRTSPNAAPLQGGYAFDTYWSPHDLCKTVVVSNEDSGHADTPYLFRTYDHYGEPDSVKNPGPAHRHEIWKVARATSAAPTYFSPVIIDEKEYYDGGIGNNNPVMLMLEEVAAKAETKSYDEAMSIVVSIGAGLKPSKRLRAKHRFPRITSLRPLKAISKVLDKLRETSTDSERDHHNVESLFSHIKFDHYYRWNGGEEVGGLALDEWHPNPKGHKPATDKFIEKAVKHYMSQEGIRQRVDECARKLVKQRRDRAAYRPENGTWRRRTHCTVLRCPYCDILLEDRINLEAHIIQRHPEKLTPQIPIEALVQQMEERPPQFPGGPF